MPRTILLMLMTVMLYTAVSQLYRFDCKTGKSLSEIHLSLKAFDPGKRLLSFDVVILSLRVMTDRYGLFVINKKCTGSLITV